MLSVKNLTVDYRTNSETPALSNVSFSIKPGERVALIGANGAGKSTLLLSIVGILTALEGNISVDGVILQKNTAAEVRRKAALVMQNPDDQLFMPTVDEDIAFGLRNCGCTAHETAEKVNETLTTLGITHLKDRMTHHLSGGEKRLAALAGILALEPSLILMDEPSSFLDPRSRRRLIAVLSALPQAMLVATHDIDFAQRLCSRVILLNHGNIHADGSAQEILGDAELLETCGL
jgi:cobalt/nickel transport system ATP-binding protein